MNNIVDLNHVNFYIGHLVMTVYHNHIISGCESFITIFITVLYLTLGAIINYTKNSKTGHFPCLWEHYIVLLFYLYNVVKYVLPGFRGHY